MSTSTSVGNNSSPLKTLAYASAIISGGVVGADYATWFKVNPVIGTLLGSAVSSILTSILLHLQADPGGKIKEAMTGIGALIGMILGVAIGMSEGTGASEFFGGLIVGAMLGGMAGQMLAAFISCGALFLLFISRGPVGILLLGAMLDGNQSAGLEQTDGTAFYDLFAALTGELYRADVVGWITFCNAA